MGPKVEQKSVLFNPIKNFFKKTENTTSFDKTITVIKGSSNTGNTGELPKSDYSDKEIEQKMQDENNGITRNKDGKIIKTIKGDEITTYERDGNGRVTDEAVSFNGVQNNHTKYEYDDEGKVTSQKIYSGKAEKPFETWEYNSDGQIKTRIQYNSGEDGQATTKEYGRWERSYNSPTAEFPTTESFIHSKGVKYSETQYDPKTGKEIKSIQFDQNTGEQVEEKAGSGYQLPKFVIPE